MNKDEKNGIRLLLEKLNTLKTYDLEWEWIAENKEGEGQYFEVEDVKNIIIDMLKS
jgi:hypothetical protein